MRIGVLVVHGIGDQARYEHLQSVSQRLISALIHMDPSREVSVEMYPGIDGGAPLSIVDNAPSDAVQINVHEVWWRDLGKRPSFTSLLDFWMWAASLGGTRGYFADEGTCRKNPDNNSTRDQHISLIDRIILFFKTTYCFVLLAPVALLAQLVSYVPGVGRLPLLRVAFTYLSSVQMYQQRHWRQSGTLVDFDQSRRVSIQRRFAASLIDMANAKYDRWYILAHSLGSVIAFKGLMYDGVANARLLSLNKWNNAAQLRASASPETPTAYFDIPRCPVWLNQNDAIDMRQVLARCHGLLTYGSPLETFARIWPAIVQIDTNPKISEHFEWINVFDPADIVASKLTSFGMAGDDERGCLRPKNVPCRSSHFITSAHTRYFYSRRGREHERAISNIMRWMVEGQRPFLSIVRDYNKLLLSGQHVALRKVYAYVQWLAVLLVGCIVWPMSMFLILRGLGFLVPALYFLGEDWVRWFDDVMSGENGIVWFPYYMRTWMVETGLPVSVVIVISCISGVLGVAAVGRYMFEGVVERTRKVKGEGDLDKRVVFTDRA